MQYRVDFSDGAEEDLKKLPADVAKRIKNKILFPETVPNPRKFLDKITGKYDDRVYRYRAQNFRAYLTFKDEVLVIVSSRSGFGRIFTNTDFYSKVMHIQPLAFFL